MEQQTTISILFSVVCVVVVATLVKAFNWLWLRPKKMEKWLRQQGFVGTSYKFFYGDLNDFALARFKATQMPINGFNNDYLQRVEPFRIHLMSIFGKEYFSWEGPIPVLHLSRPELFREALTKVYEFEKPKLNPIADKYFPGFGSYEGHKWAKHRKIINPAFHLDKLKLMQPAFHASCAEMINEWDKIIAETGSSEIDLWPYLTSFSADLISRAAFGSSYRDGQRIFELLREQLDLTLSLRQTVYIPGSRFIPTKRNKKFNEVDDEIRSRIEIIAKKRKEEIDAGEITKVDLLGTLLDSNIKETQQATSNNMKQKLGLSIQEVIDECKLFYLGGQETTSVFLVWTMILLSKHQDWQTRAREEVLHRFGNNVPDFEGLNHLKTVTMILYEVLRLYPPATQLNRIVKKDVKLGEISLPKGSMINFQMVFMHHDKEIWGEDVEEFKPERFSEGVSKATRGKMAYFPFGWGPRICIGEKFAMIEVKMALSMILQRFSFQLSPSYSHAPVNVIFFLQPQHGAQIILNRI